MFDTHRGVEAVKQDCVAIEVDGEPVTLGETIALASLLGSLEGIARQVDDRLRCLMVATEHEQLPSTAEVQRAFVDWRSSLRLSSADELHAWLDYHGISSRAAAGFARRQLLLDRMRRQLPELRERVQPPPALRHKVLVDEVVLSGLLPPLISDAARCCCTDPDLSPEAIDGGRRQLEQEQGGAEGLALTLEPFEIDPARVIDWVARYYAEVERSSTDEELRAEHSRALWSLTEVTFVQAIFGDEHLAREVVAQLRGGEFGAAEPGRLLAASDALGFVAEPRELFVEEIQHEPRAMPLVSAMPGELCGPVQIAGRWQLWEVENRQEPRLEEPGVRGELRRRVARRVLGPRALRRVRFLYTQSGGEWNRPLRHLAT